MNGKRLTGGCRRSCTRSTCCGCATRLNSMRTKGPLPSCIVGSGSFNARCWLIECSIWMKPKQCSTRPKLPTEPAVTTCWIIWIQPIPLRPTSAAKAEGLLRPLLSRRKSALREAAAAGGIIDSSLAPRGPFGCPTAPKRSDRRAEARAEERSPTFDKKAGLPVPHRPLTHLNSVRHTDSSAPNGWSTRVALNSMRRGGQMRPK